MQLEDAEADVSQDELAAERSATSTVVKPRAQAAGAKTLPRASAARAGGDCSAGELPCCGSTTLSKLGEDVTETLEVVPRQCKVIQMVRERFSCRQMRGDHAAAGSVPCHAARLRRPEPLGR
jgi:transposase